MARLLSGGILVVKHDYGMVECCSAFALLEHVDHQPEANKMPVNFIPGIFIQKFFDHYQFQCELNLIKAAAV